MRILLVVLSMLFLVACEENEIITEELMLIDINIYNDPVREDELRCLHYNVYFESKHEPRLGKILTAKTTLNRVEHTQFPNSVCEVVYEENERLCQFSWVCDPDIKLIRNVEYYDTFEVAYHMYYGISLGINMDDEFNDILFFHADYVDPKWKYKRIIKAGRHIFYSL